jgi:hypothetical protein
LSKIEVQFKVQANPSADLRKALNELESLYMKAMGGIEFGIAAVQLCADSNGHVNPQGRGFIWVCDLDGRRAVCNGLVQSLKSEEAAIFTDVFLSIGCRQGRPPVVTECADPVLEEPTLKSTTMALKRFYSGHCETSLVLPTTLPDGKPLPWRQDDSGPQLPLSALGPALPAGQGILDLREIFPATEQLPSVNLVCAALTRMVERQAVMMYEEDYCGSTVRVVRLAAFDSWIVGEGEAEMSD